MERQAEGPLSFYQRFLRITSPYSVLSVVPARALAYTHTHMQHTRTYIYIHMYPRSLSFLSSPSSPSTSCPYPPSPSTPFSFLPLLVVPHRLSSSSSLLYICTWDMSVCVYARLISIVVREVSCRTGSTLPRREGGFVRG